MDGLIKSLREYAALNTNDLDDLDLESWIKAPIRQLAVLAKKAADELEKAREIVVLWDMYGGSEGITDAFERAEKARWIPVEERLPEENGHYLVVLRRYGFVDDIKLNDKNVKILRFHDGQWRYPVHIPEWINETLTQEVTHWMKLPALPKEDEA